MVKLRIGLIVTPSSLCSLCQGILLLQLGGGGGKAPAAAAQRQQDPHRGLGELNPSRVKCRANGCSLSQLH